MGMLDNFRAFDFSEGVPQISVTRNGLTFNQGVVKKLGCAPRVRLLIDDENQQIALQICAENAPNSAEFYKPKKSGAYSVRWNGRDLLNTISDLMGWDLEKHGYRTNGTFLRDEQAMLFDLKKATELS